MRKCSNTGPFLAPPIQCHHLTVSILIASLPRHSALSELSQPETLPLIIPMTSTEMSLVAHLLYLLFSKLLYILLQPHTSVNAIVQSIPDTLSVGKTQLPVVQHIWYNISCGIFIIPGRWPLLGKMWEASLKET